VCIWVRICCHTEYWDTVYDILMQFDVFTHVHPNRIPYICCLFEVRGGPALFFNASHYRDFKCPNFPYVRFPNRRGQTRVMHPPNSALSDVRLSILSNHPAACISQAQLTSHTLQPDPRDDSQETRWRDDYPIGSIVIG
jgi:hypothetical protein